MIDGIGSGSSFGSLMGQNNFGDAVNAARFSSLSGRADAVRGLVTGAPGTGAPGHGRTARHTEMVAEDEAAAPNAGTIPADVTQLLGERNGVRMVRSPEQAARLYDQARTPEDKKVKETADQFVSILYSMLFKQLDATVEKSGLINGGQTEKMFQSFVLDEYAKQAATQNSNNPVSHRIYEMLYEATAARRATAPASAPTADATGEGTPGAASSPRTPAPSAAASSFSTNG